MILGFSTFPLLPFGTFLTPFVMCDFDVRFLSNLLKGKFGIYCTIDLMLVIFHKVAVEYWDFYFIN